MLTLIPHGQVYACDPVGRASVLLVGGKIGRIGNIDHTAVEASGCLVREGKLQLTERFLQDSQRRIELYGEKN